jgi:hypothetical protein
MLFKGSQTLKLILSDGYLTENNIIIINIFDSDLFLFTKNLYNERLNLVFKYKITS